MSDEKLAIVPIQQRELTPQIWQMISQMAPVMWKSRLFGVVSQEAAAAIMLKGYELGLSITASFEFIHVIQGKPGLSPRGALALLHSHPDIEKVEIKRLMKEDGSYMGHSCTIKRKSGFEYTAQFTLEDAKRAGLIKPDSGWTKYPEQMCMWRAVGFAADVAAPDITAGMTTIMKMPDELGVTITDSGEVIDVQAAAVSTKPQITLEQLLEQFEAEAIMAANGGKIPATQEEIEQVFATLNSNGGKDERY
jgi:hypothetical protein